jgi:hypothetical protein
MPYPNDPSVPTTSFALEYDRTFDGSEVSTAVAELPTGATIRLGIADHFVAINELPGVDRELVVLAHPTTGVRRLDDVAPRIARPETWHTQWSVDFYGVVGALGVDPIHGRGTSFHVLDVGVGSVYVHPSLERCLPAADPALEGGDALYVPAATTEVWDVHP